MTCTNIVPKRGCVLASNTSYLDIDQIADATNRPQDGTGTTGWGTLVLEAMAT